MSDYHTQAAYLLKRGYFTGMDVQQLSEKLSESSKKPVPKNCNTRESVYGKDVLELIEKIRTEADQNANRGDIK